MPVENNTGHVYKYRGLRFYAKNGFICLHDEDDGSFFVLTRKEFLQRAAALSDEAKRLRHIAAENPGRPWLAADRMDLQSAIENMIAACREAADQGDRNEPEVAAWYAKHRPHARSRVSMASAANFTTTQPGTLPRGKDTGKLVTPDFSVGVNSPKKLILPGDF